MAEWPPGDAIPPAEKISGFLDLPASAEEVFSIIIKLAIITVNFSINTPRYASILEIGSKGTGCMTHFGTYTHKRSIVNSLAQALE